ncbi:Spc97/Spc98 [Cordyceps fumosorosea ARSEF 2679]|uniref:Spindle pole body component n=1 Tax=Cordyceps fumosorosea (strain ARSEF 2679) TaxID=1081104 RepID=A0A167YC37_CORFA|nr:Spc97/Spc98 [Cordyceps fumosorosea ARSEF 2679]OAA66144.1 Spc97/Spc98 [Cordyceps fumosorosea ARSEF 2679]
MAFAAQLENLTGDLVAGLTQPKSKNDKSFLRTRDATLRVFKAHKFLRTNHFEVEKSLVGLEERFRVNNRDALADELKTRLDTLRSLGFKWYPETLNLLLELADQPTYNTRLENISRVCADDADQGPKLRWEDIAQEDGWAQDSDLWDSINYSDESGDEIFEGGPGDESDESSSFGGDAPAGRTAQDLIIQPQDNDALKAVLKQQEWKQEEPTEDTNGRIRKVGLSETQALREVLFMLHGLPTTLFDADGAPDPVFQISNIAWQTHKSLLTTFSEAGGYISILRHFAAQREKEPQLQALQDCVAKRLRVLDNHLARIQERLADPAGQVVVSLIAVREELTPVLEPLFKLSAVILKVQQNPTSDNFRYLELLFDESSMAQLTGNQPLYEFLARIFLECFTVYLREIRSWVEEGRLLPSDEAFFIYHGAEDLPLGGVWQHRFKLRRGTDDGKLLAPKFVHPAADKIYTTGKSIVILRRLGRLNAEGDRSDDGAGDRAQQQVLTYESVCPPGFESAPFPDLFDAALGQWIDRKYTAVSATLKAALFDDCGFENALRAYHAVYLMSDGAAAAAFCERLFAKLDAKDAQWQNRRALTTSAQEAFAGTVDASRLSVSVDGERRHVSATEARGSVAAALPLIRIAYRPEWPVQMILDVPSAAHYQAVFTFLLQIKRAAHALRGATRQLRDDLRSEHAADDAALEARGLFYAARAGLLWFVDALQTYVATVVLVPQTARMRRELRAAPDVDGMMAAAGPGGAAGARAGHARRGQRRGVRDRAEADQVGLCAAAAVYMRRAAERRERGERRGRGAVGCAGGHATAGTR